MDNKIKTLLRHLNIENNGCYTFVMRENKDIQNEVNKKLINNYSNRILI